MSRTSISKSKKPHQFLLAFNEENWIRYETTCIQDSVYDIPPSIGDLKNWSSFFKKGYTGQFCLKIVDFRKIFFC